MRAIIVCVFLLFAIEKSSAEVQPHPSGCPSRAFCGCGAAKYLGLSDRSLWLARSWYRFPPATPGPGTVAVWRNHVAVVIEYLGGGRARLYDANSGGHATRIHVRSIAGASIRQPSATSVKFVERPSKRAHQTGQGPVSVSAPSVPLLHTPS